jgi:fatty acid desaturase
VNKKYFSKRPDAVSLIVVMGHLLITVFPVYIAAYARLGWLTVLCWLFFGCSMNGILNLMHECCHYHVFKKKRGSEVLGRYLVAPLMIADFEGYRQRHWDHHKYLGVEGETKDSYLIDIHGKNLFLLFLRSVLMVEMFQKFSKQIPRSPAQKKPDTGYNWIKTTVLFQAVFFSTILFTAYQGHPSWSEAFVHAGFVYAFVYAYGLISLTVFMADLRAIAEHQLNGETTVQEGYAGLRNFKCSSFERFFFGAYGFGEHYTHHKIAGIPYYHLLEATQEMAREDESLKPTTGYLGTLKKLARHGQSAPIRRNDLLQPRQTVAQNSRAQ